MALQIKPRHFHHPPMLQALRKDKNIQNGRGKYMRFSPLTPFLGEGQAGRFLNIMCFIPKGL